MMKYILNYPKRSGQLARFAQTHSHFPGDEAIDGLLAERWQSPRPRQRRWR
jgi:hypothetical protein